MKKITYEIPKEDYEMALKDGPESIIGESILQGYGVYSANVTEVDGKYYLSYERGESCD